MVLKIISLFAKYLLQNLKGYLTPLLLGGVIILAGCSAWYYANQADKLTAELTALSFQKGQLEVENYQLEQQLQAEKQAVENQQKIANQLQEQVNARTETVRTIFKTEPCAHTRLPAAAIEQLREAKARP